MRAFQRRILSALLKMCNNDMIVHATIAEISEQAGLTSPGGAITDALELLEYHNKILKIGDRKWKITI